MKKGRQDSRPVLIMTQNYVLEFVYRSKQETST